MTRQVQCAKLGREAEGLARPPYPGVLGRRIFEEISKEAWDLWLARQTMLINENRLSLVDPDTRKFLGEQMEAFLFGEGGEVPEGYIPPSQ
ncbi:MAG: oxidative damage protection protein [Gammaproteobacteria bacterium]|nr:oxidative damage protection protein [Gammaproteobacteria bacterium]